MAKTQGSRQLPADTQGRVSRASAEETARVLPGAPTSRFAGAGTIAFNERGPAEPAIRKLEASEGIEPPYKDLQSSA